MKRRHRHTRIFYSVTQRKWTRRHPGKKSLRSQCVREDMFVTLSKTKFSFHHSFLFLFGCHKVWDIHVKLSWNFQKSEVFVTIRKTKHNVQTTCKVNGVKTMISQIHPAIDQLPPKHRLHTLHLLPRHQHRPPFGWLFVYRWRVSLSLGPPG